MSKLLIMHSVGRENSVLGRIAATISGELSKYFSETKLADTPIPVGDYSHILYIGAPNDLRTLKAQLPPTDTTVVYAAYMFLPSSVTSTDDLELINYFDLVATQSDASTAALQDTLSLYDKPSKYLYIKARSLSTIPPGVSRAFEPPKITDKEAGKEELRLALFKGGVSATDTVIYVDSDVDGATSVPAVYAAIPRIEQLIGKKTVLVQTPRDCDPLVLAGNGLEEGVNIFNCPRSVLLNTLSAADFYLNAGYECVWDDTLLAAMATGVVAVASDDHVLGDVVSEGRGVLVPASEFGPLYPGSQTYMRTVTSDGIAHAIADCTGDAYKEVRETGIAWTHSNAPTAEQAGLNWARLLGVA